VFRIVEFISPQGFSITYSISHHEYFLYAFDAATMFFALLITNIWHPGKVLVDNKTVYTAQFQGALLQNYGA
jgi:hypothetical protein